MAFGGPPTPPRNAEHLRPLLNGFADISQPAGSLNFRPHFQCMNGWERQKIIDHPGHWKSVKCEFLSDIYRHSTVSFMFFPASAPDDSAVGGVLCLGTLENSFLFFVVREGRTPPEIASIFDDADIAKIGFDSEKCVRELRRCAVFERINNVLSLRDKFDFDFWNNSVIIDRLNEVTRLTDRVKIGGDLIKFVLLCTRHDAYKLAVRKYNFELDLSAKPDDSGKSSRYTSFSTF